MRKWENITLEISLKPFFDKSTDGIRKVGEKLFRQWEPLLNDAKNTSLLFWAADGSEILEYKGNMDEEFEWGKWIGTANPEFNKKSDIPSEMKSVHERPRLYCENPNTFTYGEFKKIINELKLFYHEKYGETLKVGATFDCGPEFAISKFKYSKHKEICRGFAFGGNRFVCCYTDLHADPQAYAGFPNGIKKGTSIGKFFGLQAHHFLKDLDFDYIWFSNGFGFGMEPWQFKGSCYDGEKFDLSNRIKTKKLNMKFWHDFRAGCKYPIENRGTNFSTGLDLATDAVPLREIYEEVTDLEAPVNCPWGALNGSFGSELAGWMGHIAVLPKGKGYPFRFYTHDPWFLNSPWIDRYDRRPHDIYLPMSVSRLNEKGLPEAPYALKFLTADDSRGQIPDQVPEEVIPHIKQARRITPDEPGPFVWVYPFDEVHNLFKKGIRAKDIFFGDEFITASIQGGMPINTVISTRNYAQSYTSLRNRILIIPTTIEDNPELLKIIINEIKNGQKVVFYGPIFSEVLSDFFELEKAEKLDGEFTIKIENNTPDISKIFHSNISSGGFIEHKIRKNAVNAKEKIVYCRGPKSWSTLVTSSSAVWLRGTNPFKPVCEMLNPKEYFDVRNLFRTAISYLGWEIGMEKIDKIYSQSIISTLHYHDNALYGSFFSDDSTVSQKLRYDIGAPLFSGMATYFDGKNANYPGWEAESLEARVFIEKGKPGVITNKIVPSVMPGIKRRLFLQRLKNTTICFRVAKGFEKKTIFLSDPCYPFTGGTIIEADKDGIIRLENLNDSLMISW